jgi:hypothetical protein
MPIVQRRSKPVNGRLLAFSLFAAVVGVVVGVVLVGSVDVVGVLFSFVGDVPVVGVGVAGFADVVGDVPVVGVVGVGGVWP